MPIETTTTGQRLAADVGALLRARLPLLWVVTPEEGRVERALIEAAAAAKYSEVRLWDCVSGVTDAAGKPQPPGKEANDATVVLNYIRDNKTRAVWILRDLPEPWLKDPYVCRAVRNLAKSLPKEELQKARAIIILSASAEVPPSLQDHAILVKWSLPDRTEIASIFDGALQGVPESVRNTVLAEGVREAAIEAAVGLSAEATSNCFAKSLVQERRIVPSIVATEKKRVVSGKGIEWFDPDPRGLGAVGGLDLMKPWLVQRRLAFSERARAFGLPVPRGVLLVGVSGCLHGDTPIHDPVDNSTKTVRQRQEDGDVFHVTAMTPQGSAPSMALPPQRYDAVPMFRFTLADGSRVTVTERHRFMATDGSWIYASEVVARLRRGERVHLASSSAFSR